MLYPVRTRHCDLMILTTTIRTSMCPQQRTHTSVSPHLPSAAISQPAPSTPFHSTPPSPFYCTALHSTPLIGLVVSAGPRTHVPEPSMPCLAYHPIQPERIQTTESLDIMAAVFSLITGTSFAAAIATAPSFSLLGIPSYNTSRCWEASKLAYRVSLIALSADHVGYC